jgi:trans-aconitate methyltransferase
MHRWDAADYAKNSSQQALWARELIDRINWRGDEHVLDVGCGDGKITAELAQRTPRGRVIGIDVSADMVRFARESFTQIRNLEFRQMDAARIEMPEQFDLVFSNAALHWVPDHRAFLRGAAAVMKPGAKMLTSCGGRGNAEAVRSAMMDVIARDRWKPFFIDKTDRTYWFHDHTEYEPWLKKAGLDPIRVALVPKDMVHQGAPGLAGWFRTTWLPHTQRVPESQREEFINEVVEEYLRHRPLDERGMAHVEMVRLEVEAVRRR